MAADIFSSREARNNFIVTRGYIKVPLGLGFRFRGPQPPCVGTRVEQGFNLATPNMGYAPS